MEWYVKVLRQYADFEGRARRKEFWMFQLFHLIILFTLAMIGGVFAAAELGVGMIAYVIYALGTIIPSLALSVRRMHDLDKSGWMLLVGIIPLIGPIWLLILYMTEGTQGENAYGPDPKAASSFDMIDEIGE